MTRGFLFLVVAFAGALLLLWLANLPRHLRHRQIWSPVASFLLVVTVLLFHLQLYQPASAWWLEFVARAEAELGRPPPTLPAGFTIVANLLLLTGYFALKALVNAPLRIRRVWSSRLGLGPAYDDDPEQGVHLRAEWVFPGILFRYAGWGVAGGLLLLIVVDAAVRPLPPSLPVLPVLPLLLLLETGWYPGGNSFAWREGELSGADAQVRRVGEYSALWEEYQQLWPAHLLAATDRLPRLKTGATAAPLRRWTSEGDEVQQTVTRVWQDLLAAGHPVSDLHYEILDQLWRGNDVLVGDASYASVAPILFAALQQRLLDGGRVLVLVPSNVRQSDAALRALKTWLDEGLSGWENRGGVWSIKAYDELQHGRTLPDVLVASVEELLEGPGIMEPWFERLHTVLFMDAAQVVFQAPMLTEGLITALRRRCSGVQQVILAADRRALESAMRDILGVQVREFRTPPGAPATAYVICWRLEGSTRFRDAVLPGQDPYIGAEQVLALPAWRNDIRPIRLVGQEQLPWDEHLEELDNCRQHLREPFKSLLAGTAHKVLDICSFPQVIPGGERAFMLVRDSSCNLAESIHSWLSLGSETVFIHVVAPPYLLRDYLADNLDFFLQAPLRALSARSADSRLVVTFIIIERLIASALEEQEVLKELRAVEPDAQYVEDSLVALVRDTLGVDLLVNNLIVVEQTARFDEHSRAFERVVTYQISPRTHEMKALDWLRLYRILDQGQREVGQIVLDHLYQTYLPGQVHAFQGKPFRIERVDHSSRIVWVDHVSSHRPLLYRSARDIVLAGLQPSRNPAHRFVGSERGWPIELEILEGTFTVRTPRYYSFAEAIDLSLDGHTVTALAEEQVPPRSYRERQLLRLMLSPPEALDSASRDSIAATLCILLQELFFTLYPETHRFLIAAAPGAADQLPNDTFGALLPTLTLTDSIERPPESTVVLYFFEDSHSSLGLLGSLFDSRNYVLMLLEDYLSWVLEEERRPTDTWRKQIPARDHYVRFGMDSPALDIVGTHEFLRSFLGDDRNLLRTRRQAFYAGEYPNGTGPVTRARECDFCGLDVAAAEFETLDDGRDRCLRCSETAIDRLQQLRHTYDEARRFLTRDLRQSLRKDIQVEFASADRIHEVLGRRFLPTSRHDARAIGLARKEGNRFSILIEQGHPHHRTLATIVHELTHIWQFTRLDYQRTHEEHGLLLIEGHAVWAEIACLERHGLAPEYRELLTASSDVYGRGYRMLLEWQRRNPRFGNPFEMLQRLYPAPVRW